MSQAFCARLVAWVVLGLTSFSLAAQSQAQPAPPSADTEAAELQKKLANPISDLVSVPFQFNWSQDVGPNDQTQFLLNVQPVMPFKLNEDWNMIARMIVPFLSQPPLSDGGAPAFGVSDVLTSLFFSPSKGGLTWGVGPAISFPSTNIPTLGTEKWSAGPTVVALKQSGPWTYGVLWNQIWSFSGNPSRSDVSQMFVQPFLAYNTKSKWTFTLQSETTANWKAVEGEKWSVPINVLFAKLSSFGVFPASYQFGFGVFAAHPEIGPSWKIRTAIVILLPRRQ